MPMAQVKEGVFHTHHRSAGEIAGGRKSGEGHHEVQFGGVSPANLKAHTVLPHLDEMQKAFNGTQPSWKEVIQNLHHHK